MKVVLTIAGSDSGGGAGIQADLKTFEAHGVFGVTAITGITAQNTTGVQAVHDLPPEIVRAQIVSVFDDFDVAAVKIGMLSSEPVARAVAAALRERARAVPIVLDPVMLSTSGHRLLPEDAVAALIEDLFPLATLVTPNAAEAALLSGLQVKDLDAMRTAAHAIRALGTYAVLIKGGHILSAIDGLDGMQAADLLMQGKDVALFPAAHIDTPHTHGTGCTLSAAIAANLAGGGTLYDAVRRAKSYVFQAIAHAPGIGSGHGPLMHRWRSLMYEERGEAGTSTDPREQ